MVLQEWFGDGLMVWVDGSGSSRGCSVLRIMQGGRLAGWDLAGDSGMDGPMRVQAYGSWGCGRDFGSFYLNGVSGFGLWFEG